MEHPSQRRRRARTSTSPADLLSDGGILRDAALDTAAPHHDSVVNEPGDACSRPGEARNGALLLQPGPREAFRTDSSVLRRRPSVLRRCSSMLHHGSSTLRSQSGALRAGSSVLRGRPSVLRCRSSVLRNHFEVLRNGGEALRDDDDSEAQKLQRRRRDVNRVVSATHCANISALQARTRLESSQSPPAL